MVKRIAEMIIVDLIPVILDNSLNTIPRNAISSNIAGKSPTEIIDKIIGAGESLNCS
jgi:hypothetical protein